MSAQRGDVRMKISKEAATELVAAVAADFARVRNWSVFWQPVWRSIQGRDYGRAVAYETGWSARYDDLGPNSGPTSVKFKLPSGGAVEGSETNVAVTHPNLVWSALLDRDQLTSQEHQRARDLATTMLGRYVAVMAQHLGQPDIGPARYGAKQAPAGLLLNRDGVIAAWRRHGGTIQISAIEINDYETEPINLLISMRVVPGDAGQHA